jgi:hypothetical protein
VPGASATTSHSQKAELPGSEGSSERGAVHSAALALLVQPWDAPGVTLPKRRAFHVAEYAPIIGLPSQPKTAVRPAEVRVVLPTKRDNRAQVELLRTVELLRLDARARISRELP